MKEYNFSEVRSRFKEILDKVVSSKKPIKIKRRDHASVILIGEEEYKELAIKKNNSVRAQNGQKANKEG